MVSARLLVPHRVLVDRHADMYGEDRDDLATLARAGVSVVRCPLISRRYGDVLRSYGAYRRAGVDLCLGTDSSRPT
ncbi:hypothetical protein ACFV2S_10045 [Streptomyces sp. NPDC059695]|uniref:hypothetical protein n=1 Tax=Streptomyces sp. NPDC059695 TaxID=3346910 RepID=UPI0036ACC299